MMRSVLHDDAQPGHRRGITPREDAGQRGEQLLAYLGQIQLALLVYQIGAGQYLGLHRPRGCEAQQPEP